MTLKIASIKIPLVALIITLLAVAVMVKLGFWQLDRAAQKQALFDDYNTSQTLAASQRTNLNTVNRPPERFEPVAVTGDFDQTRIFLIDNQLVDGQPGYHVIGLFEAASKEQYIPVNLGWVKAPSSRQQLPTIELPTQKITLEGLVQYPEANVFINQVVEPQTVSWPNRVQQFIPGEINEITGIPLTSFVVLLDKNSPHGFKRNWQPEVMPPAKHHGYALQWFSLAFAALVIFTIAIIKINKQKREETS
ncbi:SURF1 family protein [Idiomarina seosinensis]|uniref:SURF1-like protein n=1 Tax=Idiomarina seosinensis TaxID=281739 RepID=A0A432ZDJ1_9GAMM|nr:SURF1 family protein [Idiomarina seosinensis]RUO76028.1 SURF1 family protein [Idiomarina seosinensis]